MTVEGKFNRAGSPRRIWLLVIAFQLVTTRALAQEEKLRRPFVAGYRHRGGCDGGLRAAPSCSKSGIAELNQRMHERRRRARRSPRCPGTATSTSASSRGVGNGGVGWIRDDLSAHQFPQYCELHRGCSWATSSARRSTRAARSPTWATAPGVPRYDSINSDGAASFILNEINLRPRYQLSDNAIMRASINFAPRTGSDFALGDTVDVDLAELEYLLTKDGKTSIFAGKILPVFGIEYKERKSDQRFGITPSLIGRYTVGPAARPEDPQQAARRLAGAGRLGHQQLVDDRTCSTSTARSTRTRARR